MTPDSAFQNTQIRDWVNNRYEAAYYSVPWPDTLDLTTLTLPANQGFIVLPPHIARVYGVLDNTLNLSPSRPDLASLVEHFTNDVQQHLAPTDLVPVNQQPGVGVHVTVSVDNAADNAITLWVEGLTADNLTAGVEWVVGDNVNPFAIITAINKATTVGAVRLKIPVVPATFPPSVTQIAALGPYDRNSELLRYYMVNPPTVDKTFTFVFQRKWVPFTEQRSIAVLDIDMALVAFATGDGFREARKLDQAQAFDAIGEDKLAEAKIAEFNSVSPQFLPIGRY